MPRPKGEPTKVVRLKAAWIEPYEAEAKRTGRPLTDVLAARMEQALAATSLDETPRPSPAGRKAKSEAATGPARPAAASRPGASRPVASPRAHHPRCDCAVCKPAKVKT